MVLLAAAAVLSQAELPRAPTAASAQARAIVRVISGVRLRFDQRVNESAPQLRDTMVRTQGARLQPAKLIEFE
ncbi:hypothetical protein [Sphingomonas sp. URHD0057]|uniref:hypothetical protein n=1 Tax=Sphingomonas sp. URHD0057 TaxID=1380389 RepID=UPI00048B314D|nr:hypothetical protein [Sphingomonas sp. URHD0057]